MGRHYSAGSGSRNREGSVTNKRLKGFPGTPVSALISRKDDLGFPEAGEIYYDGIFRKFNGNLGILQVTG